MIRRKEPFLVESHIISLEEHLVEEEMTRLHYFGDADITAEGNIVSCVVRNHQVTLWRMKLFLLKVEVKSCKELVLLITFLHAYILELLIHFKQLLWKTFLFLQHLQLNIQYYEITRYWKLEHLKEDNII